MTLPLGPYLAQVTPPAWDGIGHWGWPIPTYFSLGGVSAASMLLLQWPGLLRSRLSVAQQRQVVLVQLLALLLGSALLVLDLRRPERFLLLFVNFNSASILAIGARLLTGLILITLVRLWYLHRGQAAPRVFEWTSIGLEAAIILYPAALLFGMPRAAWATPVLLLDFPVTAAIGGGAALLLLLGSAPLGGPRPLGWLAGLLLLEIVLLAARLGLVAAVSAEGSKSVAAVVGGPYAPVFWGAQVVAGLVLPLTLLVWPGVVLSGEADPSADGPGVPRRASATGWRVRGSAALILLGLVASKLLVVNAI